MWVFSSSSDKSHYRRVPADLFFSRDLTEIVLPFFVKLKGFLFRLYVRGTCQAHYIDKNAKQTVSPITDVIAQMFDDKR